MNRSKTVPSYRRHKPTSQAVVTLGGVDHYLGRHKSAASRREYDRLTGEWLAAGRSLPPRRNVDAFTVAEMVNAFRKAEPFPPSQRDGFTAAMKLLTRLYGRTPVAEFGPLALRAIREQMIPFGWKRWTINARTQCIRRIFKWGVGHELVHPDVLAALQAVEGLRAGRTTAPESTPIKPVSTEHVETCLPYMTPTVTAMTRLLVLTGMRAGEVCSMKTGEIDTNGATWIYRPASHKTAHHGKVREIPLGRQAQDVLRPFLLPGLAEFIFSPARAEQERRQAAHAARTTPIGYGNTIGSNRVAKPAKTPGERYFTDTYRQALDHAIARAFPVPANLA